jgi:hypothetical protein
MTQNMNQLVNELAIVFDDLKSGNRRVAEVKELHNCAGKMISGCMALLAYANMRKETPHIPFLVDPNSKKDCETILLEAKTKLLTRGK